jgi:ribosomal protein S18 acetylase RimI-like enzyme
MLIEPVIRLAVPGDAQAIAEFSRDHIERGLGWTYTRAKILRAIGNPTTNVAVAHEQGLVVAFGIMDYGNSSAHLVLLGVQPGRRGRGLGGRMLAWLEKCACTAGLERVRAEARVDNPRAIAFYEREGYEPRARIAGYYRGLIDGVRLEKSLNAAAGNPKT